MPEFVASCVICEVNDSVSDPGAAQRLGLLAPFMVRRCRTCKIRWLSPRPTALEYARMYERASYFTPARRDEMHDPPDPLFDRYAAAPYDYETETIPLQRAAFRARIAELRRLAPGSRTFVDIGAGSGFFVAEARLAGWQALGVEHSALAVREARRLFGVDLLHSNLEALDLHGRRFDIVHLNHVFEHFLAPGEMLGRLADLMHGDSLLVIEVPNQFASWVQRVRALRRRTAASTLFSLHHPFFFCRSSLSKLMRKRGFEILSCRTHFPERWRRRGMRAGVLRTIDRLGDRANGGGENIEIIARLASGRSPSRPRFI